MATASEDGMRAAPSSDPDADHIELTVIVRAPQLASLAALLRTQIGLATAQPGQTFMTIEEYAAHARVSSKTITYYVKNGMLEGTHFHREGRTGRRIVIHVREADEWRANRRPHENDGRSLEDLASNDIVRRRAQLALKKVKGTR